MEDILARHRRRAVPRYTSYPTAPHFRPEFAEATWHDWLADLPPADPVSLYLHVPFCRQLCWYCGCNMKLAAQYAPVAAYAASLGAEIDLLATALPARLRVSHLAWGGGTPTALSPADLRALMTRVRAAFLLMDGAELSIESDPRTLTPEMATTIGALGFTRASFGVQEFDPRVQAAINRVQPPRMVADAVAGLRGAGVRGINFDLVYGLPHQTEATLLATIAQAAALRPDRIALFGYAHVPWIAKRQRRIEETALPGPSERVAMAEAAATALVEAGYQPVGIDHFALPDDALAVVARAGRLHRNFQGYTTDTAETLLGLGTTAISRTPRGLVQAIPETGAWARAVAEGRLPVSRGIALSDDDRLRAAVIEQVMCHGTVDTAALGAAHGAAPGWDADAWPALTDLAADGILRLEPPGRVTLTPAGRGLERVVAAAWDRYLGTGAARHSVAV